MGASELPPGSKELGGHVPIPVSHWGKATPMACGFPAASGLLRFRKSHLEHTEIVRPQGWRDGSGVPRAPVGVRYQAKHSV